MTHQKQSNKHGVLPFPGEDTVPSFLGLGRRRSVFYEPETENSGSGGTSTKDGVVRMDGKEFEKFITDKVGENTEAMAHKAIEILIKSQPDAFCEMVKGIAEEQLSGDMDRRAYDAAMRAKHSVDNGTGAKNAVLLARRRASGQAAAQFKGMAVANHAKNAAILRSDKGGEPVIGTGDLASRVTLYAMQTFDKGSRGRLDWSELLKAAETAGDAPVARIVKDRMEQGTFTSGGALIPEVTGDIIGMLHGLTALRNTPGAAPVSLGFDGSNSITLPRFNSGVSASWIGEGGSVKASAPSTDQVKLTEKKLRILVIQTREFVRHAPPGAVAMIEDDMQAVSREQEESTFFRSPGSSNRPTGLRHLMSSGNRDIQRAKAGSTSTLQEIVGDLMRLQEMVHGKGKNIQRLRPAYHLQHRTWTGLQALVTNQDQLSVLAQMMMQGELFGVPYGVTTEIPEDLDQNSSGNARHTELYYTEMSEYVIADGIEAEIREADQATVIDSQGNEVKLFDTDQIAVALDLTTDAALRHSDASANLADVDWGADILGY